MSSPLPQDAALSISALIQQLADKDTAFDAAKAIADMAELRPDSPDCENNAKLVSAGAIIPLVALLDAKSTLAVQEAAARALKSLAFKNDENKIEISAAGAIPALVALLGDQCTAAVHEQAVEALWSLAVNTDNKVTISAAGAIPPLVALLGTHNTAAVQKVAAGALGSLAIDSDNRVKISGAAAPPPSGGIIRRTKHSSCSAGGGSGGSGGSVEPFYQRGQQNKDRRFRCHPPPCGTVEQSERGIGAAGGSGGSVGPRHGR